MNAQIQNNRQARLNDVALLLVRSIVAAVFIFHGSQKLFGLFGGHGISGTAAWMGSIGIPLPTFSAVAAGSTEFFGGIALLLGLGVRVAVIPMAFTMVVAIFSVHGGSFDVQKGGMEYPLTLLVVLASFVLTGAGSLTVARLWSAVRSRESAQVGGAVKHAV